MFRFLRLPLLLAASCALGPGATAQGNVWVVTTVPYGLGSAIASASDGDAVLVKTSGNYGEILVVAKSLTVVVDQGVVASCTATIRDLTASQRVEFRGLTLIPNWDSFPVATQPLRLVNNQGQVWIEDCTIPPIDFFVSAPGILVDRCANVVLLRTRSSGVQCEPARLCDDSNQIGHGLRITGGSRVVAHGCEFRGAQGFLWNSGGYWFAREGAAGILSSAAGGRIFMAGCQAIGGDGTADYEPFSGLPPSCSPGGPGLSSAGLARVLDSHTEGGAGGSGGSQFACTAADGADHVGNVQAIAGQTLGFSVSSPVREGGTIQLDFHGPASTPVWLLFSANPDFRLWNGPLLISMPLVQFAGVTDALGDLHLTRTMPSMAPGIQFGELFLQAYVSQSGARAERVPDGAGPREPGPLLLGAASLLVALDGSF